MLFRLSQDPGHLWKRYGIALSIILAFLLASHLIESHALQKAKKDAATIELSSNQRFLSQKVIMLAQTYVAKRDLESAANLAETLDEFEAAHTTLMADAASEASLGRLYLSRTPSTDEIVRNYISLGRHIPSADYPLALLNELEAKGTGEVLERLDEAVIAFEARVQVQAQWAHTLQKITLIVAVMVILLEVLIIFVPAHRAVNEAIADLRATAETDPLTRLRNRTGFDKDILEAMNAKKGAHNALTLILFDLDDFKGINDRYGHITGDAVLRRVGYRVARLPNILSAARVGGDEFAILVDSDHWGQTDSLRQITEDIARSKEFIYHPINHKGHVINVSGTVGVSRYPVDAQDLSELRRNASASLLDAKRRGRGSVTIYNSRIDDIARRRRTIQSALMSREYEADLSVVFQPIVEPGLRKIKAVEALARWSHSELGPVNPMEFLAIARESGIGQEVDSTIRDIALAEISPALNHGLIESVSINISPMDLATEGFARILMRQVESHDIRLDQVWIEVTENERLTSMVIARENLEALNQAGVRIALDDYGVGYSNIQRLAELPIQRLKIDKSIVQHIEDNPKYAGVLRSSVHLARALGAEVVAEGVETPGQLTKVERFGCKLVQGYLYFKPMPVTECMDLFKQRLPSVA
ncbi:MAG: EAL domain-containing protein [Pseudomonadota bacterium]